MPNTKTATKARKPKASAKAQKPVAKPVTGKIESAPGPKADVKELKAHNRRAR